MGVFRAAYSGIKGKKIQSIITFTIILILLLFEITGLLIHSASQQAKEDVYKQVGVGIAVTPAQNLSNDNQTQNINPIDNNMINDLMSKEHVIGYDSYLECYCSPLNFKNTKIHTGVDPSTQNAQADSDISLQEIEQDKDQVVVAGDLNVKYGDRFFKSQNMLTEGDYPDQDHQGAIVPQQLAEADHLKIGDTLSVESVENHSTVTLKIIGIYQTNLKFEVLSTNFEGEAVYRASPYNTIYTNYDTVNSRLSNQAPLSSLKVWVDSPTNIQSVMNNITNDGLWKSYQAFNLTSMVYNEFAGQLETTNTMSDNLTVLSLVFGAIILIITMTFFGNSYLYENGLYMVLGKKKGQILIIQLLQMFFIVIAALLVSLAISSIISAILNSVINISYVSANKDTIVACYDNGELDIKQNFHVYLTPAVFIGMALVSIVVAAISAIIPLLAILRLKPREILAGNKKG